MSNLVHRYDSCWKKVVKEKQKIPTSNDKIDKKNEKFCKIKLVKVWIRFRLFYYLTWGYTGSWSKFSTVKDQLKQSWDGDTE